MTKVLLVEDDNNLREIYEARLQAEGYTIVSARDGEEALVVAKAEKPDLIISDIMMPKISGFEMLDILRNTDELKAVKIIMLTALGQSDDQQRADKLGADRYLVKSQVTLEDIVRVAHELLSDTAGVPAPAQPASTPAAAGDNSSASTTPDVADNAAPAEPSGSVNGALSSAGTQPTTEDTSPSPTPEPALSPAPEITPEPTPVAETPSTTPTPDPVATEPAAEAAPASESPAATAPAKPEPVNDIESEDSKPETSAQEEAQLEAQIEDFVAGAEEQPNVTSAPVEPSSDADSAGALAPTPDPVATEPAAEAATASESPAIVEDQASGAPSLSPSEKADADMAVEQADAALVDNAVKTLADSTDDQTDDDSQAKPATEPSSSDKKGGERVIQPLDSEPKTDINVLLAQEEGATVQAQATAPESVIPPAAAADTAAVPGGIGAAKISSPPPSAPGQVDPGSIAL